LNRYGDSLKEGTEPLCHHLKYESFCDLRPYFSHPQKAHPFLKKCRLMYWSIRYVQPFLLRRRQEKGKERKEKGRYTKVTRRYILAICGADTPGPISIKFGMHVAPRNVINVSNFCNKIFRGLDLQGVKNIRFPIDISVHRYNSAQPVILRRFDIWCATYFNFHISRMWLKVSIYASSVLRGSRTW